MTKIVPTGLTATVTIGGQPYQLPAMTLDVIDAVEPAQQALAAAKSFKESVRAAVDVLAVCLSQAHPELTAPEIRRRMTFPEAIDWMNRGVGELMRVSGLTLPEPTSGEAPSGEAAAVAGETSGSSSTS